jgi:hypothetical protein
MGAQSLTRFLFAGTLALASLFAYADFTGKVVAVADGDTITVLRDKEQVKIRLAGIDAPEKNRHSATDRSNRFQNCVSTGSQHWPTKEKTATAGRWHGCIAKVSTPTLNKCAGAWPGSIGNTRRRIHRYMLSRMRRKR